MKQDIVNMQNMALMGKELKIYQWKLYPRNHIETKFELGYTFLESRSYWEECQTWKDKRKEVKIVGTVKIGALIGIKTKEKQETDNVNTVNAIQTQTKNKGESFYEQQEQFNFAIHGLASLCAIINKERTKIVFSNSIGRISFEIIKCDIDNDVKFDGVNDSLFMMGT